MEQMRASQPQSQQAAQAQAYPVYPPTAPYLQPKPAWNIYLLIGLVGILMIIVGGIVISSSGFLNTPYIDDFSSLSDYSRAKENYEDTKRTVEATGNVIEYIGILLFSICMLFVGVKDESLPANVRLGIMIALALVIGLKISGIL
ncbi:MAG: hypothetical protein AB1779_10090 [Candidatus Thermoplasmatota archaeon]